MSLKSYMHISESMEGSAVETVAAGGNYNNFQLSFQWTFH
jgi:hypothetical protein